MSLLGKAKTAANQAATKAKETAADVQQKIDLSRAYSALGEAAYEEIESGNISSDKLAPLAAKIRVLLVTDPADETPTPTDTNRLEPETSDAPPPRPENPQP
jgi:hypothetical protein